MIREPDIYLILVLKKKERKKEARRGKNYRLVFILQIKKCKKICIGNATPRDVYVPKKFQKFPLKLEKKISRNLLRLHGFYMVSCVPNLKLATHLV